MATQERERDWVDCLITPEEWFDPLAPEESSEEDDESEEDEEE